MAGALWVITDVTERRRLAEEEAARNELLEVLDHASRDRRGFLEFCDEAEGIIKRLVHAHGASVSPDGASMGLRHLHTIKGNASLFGVRSLERTCHRLEEKVRAESRHLVGDERRELWSTWEGFSQRVGRLLGGRRNALEIHESDVDALRDAVDRGSSHDHLAILVRRMTMEPPEARFERLARQAASVARRLGKPAPRAHIACGPERFANEVWGPFWAAFSHALRNAVDHGIELPEVRLEAGKPAEGLLSFVTRREGGFIIIELSDDGAGIDWEAIRRKAAGLGAPRDTREDLVQLIFADGFSTREEVSLTSGRGVGMAALREACTDLGGSIRVDSTRGRGTTWSFVFPSQHVV